MTSLLERLCLLLRISRPAARPAAEKNVSRNGLDCARWKDLLGTNRSGQTTNRLARLTYLVIQIALFAFQAGPSACAQQKAPQFELINPALASIGNTVTVGDFDGDRRIDHAEFHQAGNHRCIRVRFGNDRETHLSFTGTFAPGTLLSTDVNNDHKPDLLWIFHYKLLPAVVWIGDGLGHFASSASNEDLRALIFGYPDAKVVAANSKDSQLCLTNSPICSDHLCTANLSEVHDLIVSIGSNRRRDLGVYLSYLRERGPPALTC